MAKPMTIELALERAEVDLHIAHFGVAPGDLPDAPQRSHDFRLLCIEMGKAYLMFADRLQAERQWEHDRMREIAEQHA